MQIQKKNVIWNMIGASVNSFNSLFFIIIATRINGTEQAGIFSYGFANACILYAIGSYILRAYQVTDTTKIYSDTDYIYNRILSCLFMMVVAFGFVFIKQYDLYKSSIFILLCLFRSIEALSEALYGIMQKNGYLYRAGISMTLKAATCLILFFCVDYFTNSMLLSCISLVFANILYIFIYDIFVIKKLSISKTALSFNKIFSLFKNGFFTFALTILGIYLINAPRYAIDDLLPDTYQTIFGIIVIPATFMGLLGQYIIQPPLNTIAGYIKQGNYEGLKNIITKIILLILGLGVFVFIGAYLLEEPVLSLIYGIDLKSYKTAMMIIILGAIAYGLEVIVSYVLIALRKTGIQALFFLAVSVLSTSLSYGIIGNNGILGASIIYALSMLLISSLLMVLLIVNIRKFKTKHTNK